MKPEIKAQWLQDLRSGLFPQVRSILRADDGWCGLGVLYERYPGGKWHTETLQDGMKSRTHYFYLAYALPGDPLCKMDSCLSREVLEWAGLTDEEQFEIINMDNWCKTFAAMADWIEEHL